MSKVRNAPFTWGPKRVIASAMALLWLVSAWAVAANWCCELPAGRTEFPHTAAPAQHELAEHGVRQNGHDYTAKVTEKSPPKPADPDCAEIAPLDRGLRLAEVALAQPSAEEIAYALAPTPWPIEIPKSDAFGRWVILPPPIYQTSPFLSTIRLLL